VRARSALFQRRDKWWKALLWLQFLLTVIFLAYGESHGAQVDFGIINKTEPITPKIIEHISITNEAADCQPSFTLASLIDHLFELRGNPKPYSHRSSRIMWHLFSYADIVLRRPFLDWEGFIDTKLCHPQDSRHYDERSRSVILAFNLDVVSLIQDTVFTIEPHFRDSEITPNLALCSVFRDLGLSSSSVGCFAGGYQSPINKNQPNYSRESRDGGDGVQPLPDPDLPSPISALCGAMMFFCGLWISGRGYVRRPCGAMHIGGWFVGIAGGVVAGLWLIPHIAMMIP